MNWRGSIRLNGRPWSDAVCTSALDNRPCQQTESVRRTAGVFKQTKPTLHRSDTGLSCCDTGFALIFESPQGINSTRGICQYLQEFLADQAPDWRGQYPAIIVVAPGGKGVNPPGPAAPPSRSLTRYPQSILHSCAKLDS
jgi:hypothetical protein